MSDCYYLCKVGEAREDIRSSNLEILNDNTGRNLGHALQSPNSDTSTDKSQEILLELLSWQAPEIAKVFIRALEARADLGEALIEAAKGRPGSSETCSLLKQIQNEFEKKVPEVPPETGSNETDSVEVVIHDPTPSGETKKPGDEIATRQSILQGRFDANQAASTGSTILQVGSRFYFVSETESDVLIDIMRIGPSEKKSSVKFTTVDASAKAGVKYIHTSGEVEFAEHEVWKQVPVKIVPNDSWDATLEFEFKLSDAQNAEIARYGSRCRVKILDDDAFPSNKFREELLTRRIHDIPMKPLLVEYYKLNYSNPIVKTGTWKMMVVVQLHNMYFIWRLYWMKYLIDKVIDPTVDNEELYFGDHNVDLTAIVVFILVPFGCLHFLDFRKLTWKVGGVTRKTLQSNLLRKFLNYDEDVRPDVNQGSMILAMTRDTTALTNKGYGSLIPLSGKLGNMLLILLYKTVVPLMAGKSPSPMMILAVLLFPCIMFVFLQCRTPMTLETGNDLDTKENDLIAQVDETMNNFRLIADYSRRGFFSDRFETKIGLVNTAIVKHAKISLNNRIFANWIGTIIVCVWIFIGALEVRSGYMEIGLFLENVQILAVIGASWGDIYGIVLDMQSCFPSLENICELMNLPVDNTKRLKLGRGNLEATRKQMLQNAKVTDSPYLIDQMPITMTDVVYEYPKVGSRRAGVGGSMTIAPGHFIAFSGGPGTGKGTVLKLLGGVLLPPAGIICPSHCRILHVSEHPFFFKGTLLRNLAFGCQQESDGVIERVIAICRSLKVKEDIIKHYLIEDQTIRADWNDVLSSAQRTLLNLARALITNPEVLCIHRLALKATLDSEHTKNAYRVLRQFVDERGLELSEPAERRRPCTVMITVGAGKHPEANPGMEYIDTMYSMVMSPSAKDNGSLDALQLAVVQPPKESK